MTFKKKTDDVDGDDDDDEDADDLARGGEGSVKNKVVGSVKKKVVSFKKEKNDDADDE